MRADHYPSHFTPAHRKSDDDTDPVAHGKHYADAEPDEYAVTFTYGRDSCLVCTQPDEYPKGYASPHRHRDDLPHVNSVPAGRKVLPGDAAEERRA